MTVREELASLGHQVGTFSQSEFRRWDRVEGADLTGGYCSGVVLDWARRVLQSAPARGPAYLTYSKADYDAATAQGGESRQQSTGRRMAAAYAGHATNYVTTTNLTSLRAVLPTLLRTPEASWAGGRRGVGVPENVCKMLASLWDVAEHGFNYAQNPAGILSHDQLRNYIRWAAERTNDPQRNPRTAHGREWASFSSALDARFRDIRVTEGRQVTNKPFCNMQVVRTSPSQAYATAGHWAAELWTDGFLLNGCTVIALMPTTGGSGHAVAVHKTGNDQYHFLDPNFGVYRYDFVNLKRCLQHLFWAPYARVAADVLDRDKAVYLRRERAASPPVGTWNKMGYTIFQRA